MLEFIIAMACLIFTGDGWRVHASPIEYQGHPFSEVKDVLKVTDSDSSLHANKRVDAHVACARKLKLSSLLLALNPINTFRAPLSVTARSHALPRPSPQKIRSMASLMSDSDDPTLEVDDSSQNGIGRSLAAGAIGCSAGLLGGALGLGGGFFVVPALTSLLAVEPRKSMGTSSFVNLAVSCAACRSYLARGLASPRAAGIIASSALILARFGATATGKINSKRLKKVFGGYLIIASLLVAAKSTGLLVAASTSNAAAEASLAGLAGLGGVTGFLSGLLGIGGGTLLVPALTLGFAIPQLEAQGCSLLGMIPSSIVSSLTHLQKGNVDKHLVGYLVVGSLFGALYGSNLAAVLPLKVLRLIFSVVLGSIGLKYVAS